MSEDFHALTGFRAGSLLAGYRLEAQVGAGGMAVVFRARDERLGRLVALKILAPGLAVDAAFRRRFTAESRAATAVDDPHIIPVYEAGEAGGVLFIAMRFVTGGDLRRVLEREGTLAPGRAADLVSPVASALDAAHGAGLVHRDVKPANILVDARPGRPDHVYLSDFGVSKGAASSLSLTGAGQFLGTPDYSAPEQIEGRAVDGRTDQYALACVAYQLLAGVVPFERDQGMAVLLAHLSAPPPSLCALRPEMPAAADGVLARGMAKDPEERYASCRDFSDALRGALSLAPYHSGSTTATAPAHTPGHPDTQAVSLSARFPGTADASPAAHYASTVTRTPLGLAGAAAGQAGAGQDAGLAGSAGSQGGGDPRGHRSRRVVRVVRVIRRRPVSIVAALVAAAGLTTALTFIVGAPGTPGAHGSPKASGRPVQPGKLRWTYSTPGGNLLVEAAVPGTVYVGSEGTLTAMDAATQETRWRAAFGGKVISVPSADLMGSTVYVVSAIGTVYALNTGTGQTRWAYATGAEGPFDQPVTVSGGTAYVGGIDGKVYALDAATGKVRWTYATQGYVSGSPAVAGDTVYTGSAGETEYALDAATGQVRWTSSSVDSVGPPVVANGTVYINGVTGTVYALDAATGHVRWTNSSAAQGGFQCGPTVAGGVVYAASADGTVYALDAATGRARWIRPTGSAIVDSPAVAGGVLYVGNEHGHLYALDAATGRTRWTYTIGSHVDHPVVAGDTIYITSENNLYALSA